MSTSQLEPRLSGAWRSHVPTASESSLRIPDEIVHACLDFVSCEPETFGSGEKVLRWTLALKQRMLATPGFVCLKVGDAGYTNNDLRKVYSAVSRSFGDLNTRYGEFFDVKDRGLDHTKEAIPVSKTRASTGFHTDSSAANYCPEIVGLLCLQPAQSGGESLLANAVNLYSWLAENHPMSLKVLSRPIKRDVITPGTKQDVEAIQSNSFPIFTRTQSTVQFRYMRYWIETAYKKLAQPLPGGLRKAMNLIDSYLMDPANTYSRMLLRGEMLFVNNCHLCHSRTAFTDSLVPGQKRVLVRTWIDRMHATPARTDLSCSSTHDSISRDGVLDSAFDPALAS